MSVRHLSQAPIVEALIDIKVDRSAIPPSELADLHGRIREDYPVSKPARQWQGLFSVSPDGESVQTRSVHRGFSFTSEGGARVVQARPDGLTLSRVHGYDRWEDLRREAQRLWPEYVAVAKPNSVTRTAVRYINRIELPLPVEDLSEHFNIFVHLPSEIPQGMSEYFMRAVIPYDEAGVVSVVTLRAEPVGPDDEVVTIVLDIDVSKTVAGFSPGSEEIWRHLEKQRSIKNDMFFSALTENTIRRYE